MAKRFLPQTHSGWKDLSYVGANALAATKEAASEFVDKPEARDMAAGLEEQANFDAQMRTAESLLRSDEWKSAKAKNPALTPEEFLKANPALSQTYGNPWAKMAEMRSKNPKLLQATSPLNAASQVTTASPVTTAAPVATPPPAPVASAPPKVGPILQNMRLTPFDTPRVPQPPMAPNYGIETQENGIPKINFNLGR